jgi:HAMP domain-containing protein
MDDLSILLIAKLDITKSVATINEQVKLLSTKLQSIDLKININQSIFKELSSNFQNLSNDINKTLNVIGYNSNLDKVTDKFVKGTEGAVQKTKDYTNQLGQSVKEIQLINKETKQLETTTTYVTENYKKQRNEIDKLANSIGNLREKSEIRVSNDNNKSDLAQNTAINKVIDDAYIQAEKQKQTLIKTQQETSDTARKLTYDEQQNRLKVTTDTQKSIEQTILGSNETIAQQQKRINSTNANDYEQIWQKAFKSSENNQNKQLTSNTEKLNTEVKQAEVNMTNLQRRMGDAWNPAPFNEWLNRFKQLNPTADKFTTQLKTMQGEYKKLSADALLSMSQQNKLLSQNDNALSIFIKDTGKLALWGAAASTVYAPLRQLKLGISYLGELDNALNEIRIVTNKTQDEVNNLGSSYNKLAKEMSVTTKELASTSADLYRQGLNDNQVEERMKGIIEYAKISSISLDQSNKIITATANATGESVNKIIDIFALLGDTTA